jgi:predicted nucleic acid-binding protein
MRYFDSSVFVKLYHLEPNSPAAATHVRAVQRPIILTPLHRMEVHSAIRLIQGRGQITPAACQQAIAAFAADHTTGLFRQQSPVWPAVFARCEQLSADHAATTLCRILDTLHVALALELGATEFCTFDHRQAALASLVSCNIHNCG